jgi:hypothetical protein
MSVSVTRRLIMVAVAVAVAVGASACGDVKDLYSFSPTPVVYTETFTGTLDPGGSAFHPFAVSVAGTVTMTLTAVGPDTALTLGFDIGTWDGTTCSPIFGTGSSSAIQGYSFAGSAIAANFCVRIYDGATAIPADTQATYSIKVDHP